MASIVTPLIFMVSGRAVLTKFFIVLVLFYWPPVYGQRQVTYDFVNGLAATEPGYPALKILGPQGTFKEEMVLALRKRPTLIYRFGENSGLMFDNKKANGLLNESYTVELYFKFDELGNWKRVLDFKNRKFDYGAYVLDGQLSFFNFAIGNSTAMKPNKYSHYVFSRDLKNKTITIYVDGKSKLSFPDDGNRAVLDKDSILNIFLDDLEVPNETSAGSVALIRLYDYVVSPKIVQEQFDNMEKFLDTATKKARSAASSNSPSDQTLNILVEVRSDEERAVIQNAVVVARETQTDSVIAIDSSHQDGEYQLRIPKANQNIEIAVYAPGFRPVQVSYQPSEVTEKPLRFNLTEEHFSEPLYTLHFHQSLDSLLPPAISQLDSVAQFLKANPYIDVRLLAHTDNVGDFEKNMMLSWSRYRRAREYLLSQGIDAKRIRGQGLGPAQPISSNNYERTRSRNRRLDVWAEPQKR